MMKILKYRKVYCDIVTYSELVNFIKTEHIITKLIEPSKEVQKKLENELLKIYDVITIAEFKHLVSKIFGLFRCVSKEFWINRGYSEEESKKITSELGKNNSLESFQIKYGAEIGQQKYSDFCNRRKKLMTEDGYIELYGEQEGKDRWYNHKKRISNSNGLDRYIKLYGEKDGTKIFKDISLSKACTLEKFIQLYGPLDGLKKHQNLCKKRQNILEFYILKYGDIEGKRIFSEINKSKDTMSHSSIVKRYGINVADGIYQERKEKCKNTKDNFIRRHGYQTGILKYNQFIEKVSKCRKGMTGKKHTQETKHKMSVSTIKYLKENDYSPRRGKNENQILDYLEKSIDVEILRNNLDIALISGKPNDGFIYKYNLAIEVLEPHHFKLNGELSDYDQNRQPVIAEKLGCMIYYISEQEFLKDPEKEIQRFKDFLVLLDQGNN